MLKSNQSRPFSLLIMAFLLLLLAGCKPEPVTQEPVVTTPPMVIETSPTPAPVQSMVLVDPQGSAAAEMISLLTEFAASNLLEFRTLSVLDPVPPTAETRIIVYTQVPANLDELVTAAPQTQFIVIGDADPNGHANLSSIKSKAEDVAFMGGYLTTLIAWDWRSGGLIPTDTALGGSYRDAFENGGRYVCGQCTSTYAPFFYFPLIVEESTQAGAPGWTAQMAALAEYYVKAAFVDPSSALPEVLDILDAQDMTLIGVAGTPSAERFTALIGSDALPALEQLLPQALAGTGGIAFWTQVRIVSFTDDTLITPAKVDLFNRTAADLSAGIIIPLSIK